MKFEGTPEEVAEFMKATCQSKKQESQFEETYALSKYGDKTITGYMYGDKWIDIHDLQGILKDI